MNYEAINQCIIPVIWVMVGLSAAASALAFMIGIHFNKTITQKSETAFKRYMYYLIAIPYTIFIALVTLFPLMGMLGTVSALITLDISGVNENLRSNFFQALDTTGLGLIFAIIFKFINSLVQQYIEDSIDKAKKLLEKGWDE